MDIYREQFDQQLQLYQLQHAERLTLEREQHESRLAFEREREQAVSVLSNALTMNVEKLRRDTDS
ncbi:hypothetical protein PC114_g25336 [Phytophthora cactorum]|nr:hypothetical protein PC114_g25336 [Phytophthora cactorum]KAG3145758.1 hypothetical protein PC128_g24147 [Phytophthora cactorum]KAG4060942.1 hypothetical protein PC123_g4180 [Phytophthora cactorum]